MKLMPLSIALLALAGPVAANAPTLHANGWARAGIGSAAAYVSVHNGGAAADRLIAVSSPAARKVSVHDSRRDRKSVV